MLLSLRLTTSAPRPSSQRPYISHKYTFLILLIRFPFSTWRYRPFKDFLSILFFSYLSEIMSRGVKRFFSLTSWKPTKDQSMKTSRVQFGEPVSFGGPPVQEYGWRIIYRKRNDSKTVASSKTTLAWMIAHNSCQPGTCHLLNYNTLESVIFKWLCEPKPLPGSLLGVWFFWEADPVSVFSVWLGWSESDSSEPLIFTLKREGPSQSDQFLKLPESILSCFFRLRIFLVE